MGIRDRASSPDRHLSQAQPHVAGNVVDAVAEPAAREENQASRLAFHELLATLPEGQRKVLTMLKVGGLSLEEVARATSSTVGAVKQKAHRAYERLRSFLREAPKPRPARIAEPGVTSHVLSNNREGT